MRGDVAAYREWWKNSQKQVDIEVQLAMLRNDIQLKFIPIPSSRKAAYETKVRGFYEALVTVRDDDGDAGETKLYKVANDWVEENFTEEALGVVQRLGRDIAKVYKEIGSDKTEYGYLSLEHEDTIVRYDKRQVSQIRYIPAKRYTDPLSAEDKWREESYKGIVRMDYNGDVEFQVLTKEWVERNFSEDFIKLLKAQRNDKFKGYIAIPEGANEDHEAGTIVFAANAPKLRYYDKAPSAASRRCVLDSAASALYYIGKTKLANFINATKNDKTKVLNPFDYFAEVIRAHMTKDDKKEFQLLLLNRERKKTWDIFTSPKNSLMCVVGIHSDDGKTDHAISIVGDWIFDSNFEKALPLTQESLDICSSSAERDSKFVRVTHGYLLQPILPFSRK